MKLAGSTGVLREGARVVADRYVLEDRIAVGANAFVYSAIDQISGQRVALKVLLPAFAGDPDFLIRFRREAQTAASLTHRNIVRVLDFGTDAEPYLAMELCRGGDLHQRLARGPLSVAESVRIARGVAAALEAAHDRGVVHRDIKPHNILLDDEGEPKLADFGIARAMWLTQITRTNVVFGSPHYLAPEQARGLRVDGRADIYALGAVLYEMLTGHPPFRGDSPVTIALRHVNERPIPPRALRADVPRSLDAIVLRALSKDPRQRFQSARELGAALARAIPPARQATRPRSARVAASVPALLLSVLIASGVAVAAPLVAALLPSQKLPVALAPSALSAAPAITNDTPSARPSATPSALPTLAAATEAPSLKPTPMPVDTVEPVAALPPVAAQALGGGPLDAISRFYGSITTGNLDAALALWDARMRATYPPGVYLYPRFAATSSIAVNSATVVAQTSAAATVAVDLTELDGGVRRRWVGYWYLVHGPSGWLLDQPALRPG
jgi:serine/threonine-protein kinase